MGREYEENREANRKKVTDYLENKAGVVQDELVNLHKKITASITYRQPVSKTVYYATGKKISLKFHYFANEKLTKCQFC